MDLLETLELNLQRCDYYKELQRIVDFLTYNLISNSLPLEL